MTTTERRRTNEVTARVTSNIEDITRKKINVTIRETAPVATTVSNYDSVNEAALAAAARENGSLDTVTRYNLITISGNPFLDPREAKKEATFGVFIGYDMASHGKCQFLVELVTLIMAIINNCVTHVGLEKETVNYIKYRIVKGINPKGKPSHKLILIDSEMKFNCTFNVDKTKLDFDGFAKSLVNRLGKVGVSSLLWSKARSKIITDWSHRVLVADYAKFRMNASKGEWLKRVENFNSLPVIKEPGAIAAIIMRVSFQESMAKGRDNSSRAKFQKTLSKMSFWTQQYKDKYWREMARCLRMLANPNRNDLRIKQTYRKINFAFKNVLNAWKNFSKYFAMDGIPMEFRWIGANYTTDVTKGIIFPDYSDNTVYYLKEVLMIKNKAKIKRLIKPKKSEIAVPTTAATTTNATTAKKTEDEINKEIAASVNKIANKMNVRLPRFKVKTIKYGPKKAEIRPTKTVLVATRPKTNPLKDKKVNKKKEKKSKINNKVNKTNTNQSNSLSNERILKRLLVASLSFAKKCGEMNKLTKEKEKVVTPTPQAPMQTES